MSNFLYLKDKKFLQEFDLENHKIQFTRISVLNFSTEEEIASIEGKSTGGTVNINGTSSMRRTASCSLLVDPNGVKVQGYQTPQQYSNITEVNNLISLNKKIKLSTGFINSLAWKGVDYYPDHEIIWFPLGTYIIKSASVTINNSGTNISLTLNDKTALLNGDIGGTIPAAVVFSESELYNSTGTQREVQKNLIKNIIKDLMVEYAGENPEKVIIEDVPETITKIVKWSGTTPVYFDSQKNDLVLSEQDIFYLPGEDIGAMVEPFVYPGVLECKAGDTVSSMLDKIKNTLGNYEWFYDVDGFFHFQEIKNYLNTSPASQIIQDIKEGDYLYYSKNDISYTFNEDNKKLLISIANNPQYNNIKNDFIIWGQTKTMSGVLKPIKYHLAFDKKPNVDPSKTRLGIIYKSYNGLQQFLNLEGIDQNGYYYFKTNKEFLTTNSTMQTGKYYFIREWR